jgi:hypothetical protein
MLAKLAVAMVDLSILPLEVALEAMEVTSLLLAGMGRRKAAVVRCASRVATLRKDNLVRYLWFRVRPKVA